MLVEVENDNVNVIVNTSNNWDAYHFCKTLERYGKITFNKFFLEFPFMGEAFVDSYAMSHLGAIVALHKSWSRQKPYDKHVMVNFLTAFTNSHGKECFINIACELRFIQVLTFVARFHVFNRCEFKFGSAVDIKATSTYPYVEQFADMLIAKRLLRDVDRSYFVVTFAKINSNHHKHFTRLNMGMYI